MSVRSDQIGIWKCWFLRRGENRSTRRITSQSKGENQQQTRPTYGVKARIRTALTTTPPLPYEPFVSPLQSHDMLNT